MKGSIIRMGWRFHRSIRLSKGLRINFGKTGTSFTTGVRGAHVTVNTNGKRTTSVGIPGTGISYVKTDKIGGKSAPKSDTFPSAANGGTYPGSGTTRPKNHRGCLTAVAVFVILGLAGGIITQCSGGSSPASSAVPASSGVSSISEESSAALSSKMSSVPASNQSKSEAGAKLAVANAPGTVPSGGSASITVRGKPNTQYSIAVYYSAGKSSAGGLEAQTSGPDGTVTWTWKVGRNTKAGTHRIVVSGGGEEIETSFTTT